MAIIAIMKKPIKWRQNIKKINFNLNRNNKSGRTMNNNNTSGKVMEKN